MADDIAITVSDNVSKSVAGSIRAIGTAAKSSYSAVQQLQKAINDLGSNTNAIKTAAANVNTLRQSFTNANTAAGQLRATTVSTTQAIRNGATAATAMATNLQRTRAAAAQTNTGLGTLSNTTRSLVGLFVAGFGIQAFIQASDAATTVANKVRTVSTSLDDFNQKQKDVYALAIQNRVAVTGVATAYQRFSVALNGITNAEGVRNFIDLLTKALVTNGATVSETEAAITQLSQAFQKGKLDGDEFRTIMETLPALSGALTTALGKTKDQLFQLSKQGKITPQVILAAFKGSAQGIRDAFASTVPTIEQSLTVLNDQFIQFLSGNTATTQLLAQAILFIGNNLNLIIPVVLAFGAAWAAVAVHALIVDFLAFSAIITGTYIPAILAALPGVGAMALATLDFSLVLAAAASAVFLLALGIARLSGNEQGFLDWANGAVEKVGDLVVSMIGAGQKAIPDFGKSMTAAATAAQASTTANAANSNSLKGVSASAKTATDAMGTFATKTNSNVQTVINTLDTLIYKMNNASAAAQKLAGEIRTNGKDGFVGDSSLPDFQNISGNNSDPYGGFTNISGNTSGKGFANGGSFIVGGKSGIDKNSVTFNATKGERVDISTPAQQRAANGNQMAGYGGPRTINVTIVTPDADSFGRSRKQVGQQMKAIMGS